ncbi:hypothetical protein J6S88_00370 [bacterium]|nr:hypothetical protein [bacterium]
MLIKFNTDQQNSNITFTARCRSIETARTACRKISLYSTTKKQPFISELQVTNVEAMEFFEDLRNNYSNFERRGGRIANILTAYLDCSDLLGSNRRTAGKKLNFQSAKKLLDYVSSVHFGNCGESAESVALILKMNGIEDVYIATVKNGEKEVNHEICIFNRDGSPFDGTIKNNQTIIVDAWSGIVDFANTALKDIKSLCSKHFNLNKNHDLKVDTKHIARFELNDTELSTLKRRYPQLAS